MDFVVVDDDEDDVEGEASKSFLIMMLSSSSSTDNGGIITYALAPGGEMTRKASKKKHRWKANPIVDGRIEELSI